MSQEIMAHSLAEIEKMATYVARSNLFGMADTNQVISLMLLAQAEGIHPMTAARDFHIIKGRPALKADAILDRHIRSGGTVEWEKYSDEEVIGIFSHPKSGSVRIVWNIAKAKKAGLYKPESGWFKYPAPMMRARCTTEGVNAVNPGCKIGMYTPEEVECFDDKSKKQYKDITPAEQEYVTSLIDENPPVAIDIESSRTMIIEFKHKIDLCQNMEELSKVKVEVVTNKKYMLDADYEELKARIYERKNQIELTETANAMMDDGAGFSESDPLDGERMSNTFGGESVKVNSLMEKWDNSDHSVEAMLDASNRI